MLGIWRPLGVEYSGDAVPETCLQGEEGLQTCKTNRAMKTIPAPHALLYCDGGVSGVDFIISSAVSLFDSVWTKALNDSSVGFLANTSASPSHP